MARNARVRAAKVLSCDATKARASKLGIKVSVLNIYMAYKLTSGLSALPLARARGGTLLGARPRENLELCCTILKLCTVLYNITALIHYIIICYISSVYRLAHGWCRTEAHLAWCVAEAEPRLVPDKPMRVAPATGIRLVQIVELIVLAVLCGVLHRGSA